MEPRLELCAVVSLQDEHAEREPFSYGIEESDRCALVARIVDLQYSDARTVVDSGELVEPLTCSRDALEELHIHLEPMARLGFLVPFPAFTVRLVLLIGW